MQLMSHHSIFIRSKHSYWLLDLNFVPFFVWAEIDTFLEIIRVDTEIQEDILSKTKPLFRKLVGKYLTNSTNSDKSQDKWCICKMSEDEDDLIMCESKT